MVFPGSSSMKMLWKTLRSNLEFAFAVSSYERGMQLRCALAIGVGSIIYPPDPSFLISNQGFEALTLGKFRFKEAIGLHTAVTTYPRHGQVWSCPVLAYTLYTVTDLCLQLDDYGQPRLLTWIQPGPKKEHYAYPVRQMSIRCHIIPIIEPEHVPCCLQMLHSGKDPKSKIKSATHNQDIKDLHRDMDSSHGQTTHKARGSGVMRDT